MIENPGNSDKLAQRNLQVTTSGNPGFPATHRVPQTIDVRPSPRPQSASGRSIASYPDEIMIDWGKTPLGTVASIYWPEVSAASVLQLARQLYPAQTLSSPARQYHPMQSRKPGDLHTNSDRRRRQPSGLADDRSSRHSSDTAMNSTCSSAASPPSRSSSQRNPNAGPPAHRGSMDAIAVRDQLVWRYISGSLSRERSPSSGRARFFPSTKTCSRS